mmetsp:Transcript_29023/g.78161  ORF Transcript_29023/g.78161 Transcript_29023/m.78161 type:complete len:203 (-) Transcript_29023:249-857(-)
MAALQVPHASPQQQQTGCQRTGSHSVLRHHHLFHCHLLPSGLATQALPSAPPPLLQSQDLLPLKSGCHRHHQQRGCQRFGILRLGQLMLPWLQERLPLCAPHKTCCRRRRRPRCWSGPPCLPSSERGQQALPCAHLPHLHRGHEQRRWCEICPNAPDPHPHCCHRQQLHGCTCRRHFVGHCLPSVHGDPGHRCAPRPPHHCC